MAIMIAKKIVQNMQGFSSTHFEIFLSQSRGFDSLITKIQLHKDHFKTTLSFQSRIAQIARIFQNVYVKRCNKYITRLQCREVHFPKTGQVIVNSKKLELTPKKLLIELLRFIERSQGQFHHKTNMKTQSMPNVVLKMK